MGRSEQRDRAGRYVLLLAGQPGPTPAFGPPARATPLIAVLLVFFGAGLQRRLRRESGNSGHGAVAFGGALLAAAAFALVGMLEGAATNAAHEGQRQAVYTLSQLHSYDWLAWNAVFAAVLLATGLGARRNGMLPTPLAWATIVIGASLVTPLGFFGFFLVPVWLIVVGLILTRPAAQPPSEQTAQLDT
jgi:lysylphosphatidylglycerol synthetase-like protein (DUF2156 family)